MTAYVAAQGHIDRQRAKTLTQMAAELGASKSTVRRWLRHDHWELWMEHWASVDEIWEEMNSKQRSEGNSISPTTKHVELAGSCLS